MRVLRVLIKFQLQIGLLSQTYFQKYDFYLILQQQKMYTIYTDRLFKLFCFAVKSLKLYHVYVLSVPFNQQTKWRVFTHYGFNYFPSRIRYNYTKSGIG